jgi:hypothetical protein
MRNQEGRIDTDSDASCLKSSSDGGLVTENNRGKFWLWAVCPLDVLLLFV